MSSARVLLLVTGGIAAYKSCFLARLLLQAGFSVKVAMTEAATRFVTPLTFQVLTGNPVATDLWGEGQSDALDHIEYARWADLTVIAPATANTLAKAAHGLADDIVSTLLLAFPGPLLVAPAMNDNMWRHPATQANLQTLRDRGVDVVGPGAGFLACGTISEGRMAEPEEILAEVRQLALDLVDSSTAARNADAPFDAASIAPATGTAAGALDITTFDFWRDQQVVVTAGPTHEALDPVRYLGNRSSGAMGYALAGAAVAAGARVTLISGPSELPLPRGLSGLVSVQSARQMAAAVAEALTAGAQWLIMAAAVADFTMDQPADAKLKKDNLGDVWNLQLRRNPDILSDVVPAHRSEALKVVGFALETDDLHRRAEAKLLAKNLDYVVANDPTSEGARFGPGDHQVALLGKDGLVWESRSRPKTELAAELIARLARAEA